MRTIFNERAQSNPCRHACEPCRRRRRTLLVPLHRIALLQPEEAIWPPVSMWTLLVQADLPWYVLEESSPPQPPQPPPPSCAVPQHGSILALPDSPWKKRDLFALGLGPICLHVCSIQSSVCLEVHLEGFILPSLRPHPTLPPTQQQHHCWLRRQLHTTKLSHSIYVLPDVCLSAFLLPPH